MFSASIKAGVQGQVAFGCPGHDFCAAVALLCQFVFTSRCGVLLKVGMPGTSPPSALAPAIPAAFIWAACSAPTDSTENVRFSKRGIWPSACLAGSSRRGRLWLFQTRVSLLGAVL